MTINMLLGSVSHGCRRNNVPRTSRRAAAAFFARMDIVMRWRGGGCGNDGGGNVMALAATRARGQGEEDDAVMTVAEILVRRAGDGLRDKMRGGR